MMAIEHVIAGALVFCFTMGILLYIGRNPKPPKKPKGIVMPKLKKRDWK